MAKSRKGIWGFADNFEGDKVVWIIVLILMMFSIVCSFSSTSRLLTDGATRIDIVRKQLAIVGAGLGIIIICYNIKNIRFFRFFSRWGFIFSAILLAVLSLHKEIGPVKAIQLNDAWRILQVGGIQIHVFEVVKVAMLMYLAWALDAYKKGELKFGSTKGRKKMIYFYAPFLFVFFTVLMGSGSSAFFIGTLMFIVILLGGGGGKELGIIMLAGIIVIGVTAATCHLSEGKYLGRWETIEKRLLEKNDWEAKLKVAKFGSLDYYVALDKLRQPVGAKIAIKEGGLLGKGPGQSTQRYVVPDVSEDYMYSFIIEEYGLAGGIFIIILYVSLMARGAIIVRNCNNDFYAKMVVAGLTLLIVGQAFLHICVNADLGPMTGQTLPLISHGNSAFLCFCLAFGIILSFSRVATLRIRRETEQAAPILDTHPEIEEFNREFEEYQQYQSNEE